MYHDKVTSVTMPDEDTPGKSAAEAKALEAKKRQDYLATLANQLTGYKSWLSRYITEAQNMVDLMDTNLASTTLLEKYNLQLPKIEQAYDKVYNQYEKMMKYADREQIATYELSLREIDAKRQQAQSALLRAISLCETELHGEDNPIIPPPAPAAAAPGGATGATPKAFKTDTALKPKILKMDAKPVEFETWVLKFTDFFETSGLAAYDIKQQQAVFRSCLDNDLFTRLHLEIGPTMPVLTDPRHPEESSCMSLLQSQFLEEYPVFNRRMELFRNKQQQSQKWTDYYRQFKRHQMQCDLPALAEADLVTHLLLGGTVDPELRKLMLREEERNEKKLLSIAKLYEQEKSMNKCITHSAPAAARTNNVGRGQQQQRSQSAPAGRGRGRGGQTRGNGRGGQSQGRQTAGNTVRQLISQGKCVRCGGNYPASGNHDNCRALQATCNNCGKVGHFSSVCAAGSAAKPAGRGGQQGGGRGQNRAAARGGQQRGRGRGTGAAANAVTTNAISQPE